MLSAEPQPHKHVQVPPEGVALGLLSLCTAPSASPVQAGPWHQALAPWPPHLPGMRGLKRPSSSSATAGLRVGRQEAGLQVCAPGQQCWRGSRAPQGAGVGWLHPGQHCGPPSQCFHTMHAAAHALASCIGRQRGPLPALALPLPPTPPTCVGPRPPAERAGLHHRERRRQSCSAVLAATPPPSSALQRSAGRRAQRFPDLPDQEVVFCTALPCKGGRSCTWPAALLVAPKRSPPPRRGPACLLSGRLVLAWPRPPIPESTREERPCHGAASTRLGASADLCWRRLRVGGANPPLVWGSQPLEQGVDGLARQTGPPCSAGRKEGGSTGCCPPHWTSHD